MKYSQITDNATVGTVSSINRLCVFSGSWKLGVGQLAISLGVAAAMLILDENGTLTVWTAVDRE